MKYFKSFSARLANYLVHQGFCMVDKEPNFKKPQYDVFLFIDSPELRAAVEEYSKNPFNTHKQ